MHGCCSHRIVVKVCLEIYGKSFTELVLEASIALFLLCECEWFIREINVSMTGEGLTFILQN